MKAPSLALALALVMGVMVPAMCAAEGPRRSGGYAFAMLLQRDGSAPLGAYAAAWLPRRLGLELDLGYQHDAEDLYRSDAFTAVAGPRFGGGRGKDPRPFLHVLGGLRHDRVYFTKLSVANSFTSWGGVAGGGIDFPLDDRLYLRVGVDYHLFYVEKDDRIETMRFNVGVSF